MGMQCPRWHRIFLLNLAPALTHAVIAGYAILNVPDTSAYGKGSRMYQDW
jgi:hypothetical protein